MFRTTVHREPGMGIAAQKNKRVGFIIPEQNVIARLIELNIVVLKQECFCLRMGDGDINILDERDQRFSLTGGKVAAKIAGEAFLEIFRLPHVDNRTASVIHAINARLAGHGFQKCF